MRQQAGNSMNVLAMALIDLRSLSWTHMDAPVLFKQICDGRRSQQRRRGQHMQDVYTRRGSGTPVDVDVDTHMSDSDVLETSEGLESESALHSRLASKRLMSDKHDLSSKPRKPSVPKSLSTNSGHNSSIPTEPKGSSSCGSTRLEMLSEMLASARKAHQAHQQKGQKVQKRLRLTTKTKCTSD